MFPFIALFKVSEISISLKKSPEYLSASFTKLDIPYFNIDMNMLNIPEEYRLPADMPDYPIQSPELVNLVEAVDLLGMLAFPLMILILMAGFFINRRMMERRYD